MPVWKFDDPEPGDPPVRIGDWCAFRMPDGARHVAGTGYMSYGREGRVTSALQDEVDLATATFVTSSGRRYQLVGRPGLSLDADYVLNRWLAIQGVERKHVVDVSKSLWDDIQSGRR